MAGKSKKEGTHVYVRRSHCAVRKNQRNTVKQLYSNKTFFFFKERNHNGFKEITGLSSDSLPDMLRVEFAGQKGVLRSLISVSARTRCREEKGGHSLGAGSYSPCAPASRSSYPEPTPALL